MEGLILAHDRIATTTDHTPANILITSSPQDPSSSYTNKALNQNANSNLVNNNVLKVCKIILSESLVN